MEKVQYGSQQVSFKDLILSARASWKYLLQRRYRIIISGVLGGVLGLIYAFLSPLNYTAKISFVVEESRAGSGGLASLAGQFGFDLGGSSGAGILSGDNILLFLESEGLVRQTLLTRYDSSKTATLVDRYAEVAGLKLKWKEKPEIGEIDFSRFADGILPRKEDSIVQSITKYIIENNLVASKPDKKSTFIEVRMTTTDEMLSLLFAERLVKAATERYIESKTKTKVLNISRLQTRADSLAAILNNKTYVAAASQQSLVDVNPALSTAPISSEISSRDKMMVATIFAEVVKNLEISKTILNQETPVIQMVDHSTLPLRKERTSKLISLILGGFISGFLFVSYLLLDRWLKIELSK